jgi:hypothetical protein
MASSLVNRFRAMPRSVQMFAGIGALLILAVVWWDMRDLRQRFEKRAMTIESQVQSVRSGARNDLADIRDTVASVGEVDLPGSDQEGSEALNRVVSDLLNQYKLGSTGSFNIRHDRTLPADLLPQMGRLATIKGDFSFESSPEEAVAIIAALESNPAVECIRSLRIAKSGTHKVKVRLVLEAWVKSAATPLKGAA